MLLLSVSFREMVSASETTTMATVTICRQRWECHGRNQPQRHGRRQRWWTMVIITGSFSWHSPRKSFGNFGRT